MDLQISWLKSASSGNLINTYKNWVNEMKLIKSQAEGGRSQFTATFKSEHGDEVHSYGVITEDESEARMKIMKWAESHGFTGDDFI